MTTRARLTQDRSRARRDTLISAAIELFAEGGTRAVTHRAVAARAGVAPATTTYYFASIEDLIREALQAHLDGWIATLSALEPLDMRGQVGDDPVASAARLFAVRTPEIVAVQLAIYLAAARDDALRTTAAQALDAFDHLIRGALVPEHATDPDTLVAGIFALIAGSAVRRQSGRFDEVTEARILVTSIGHLIRGHLPR